jgi:hypothetical protein
MSMIKLFETKRYNPAQSESTHRENGQKLS